MGADIHVHVERRNKAGKWEPVYGELVTCDMCGGTARDKYSRCGDCGAYEKDHDAETGRCFMGPLTLRMVWEPCYCADDWTPPGKMELRSSLIYWGRDYSLFGVLAGVRGGPEDGFTMEDRGIPEDASVEYRRTAEKGGWHSHTYYTLKELLARGSWSDYPGWDDAVKKLRKLAGRRTNDVRVLLFFDS